MTSPKWEMTFGENWLSLTFKCLSVQLAASSASHSLKPSCSPSLQLERSRWINVGDAISDSMSIAAELGSELEFADVDRPLAEDDGFRTFGVRNKASQRCSRRSVSCCERPPKELRMPTGHCSRRSLSLAAQKLRSRQRTARFSSVDCTVRWSKAEAADGARRSLRTVPPSKSFRSSSSETSGVGAAECGCCPSAAGASIKAGLPLRSTARSTVKGKATTGASLEGPPPLATSRNAAAINRKCCTFSEILARPNPARFELFSISGAFRLRSWFAHDDVMACNAPSEIPRRPVNDRNVTTSSTDGAPLSGADRAEITSWSAADGHNVRASRAQSSSVNAIRGGAV